MTCKEYIDKEYFKSGIPLKVQEFSTDETEKIELDQNFYPVIEGSTVLAKQVATGVYVPMYSMTLGKIHRILEYAPMSLGMVENHLEGVAILEGGLCVTLSSEINGSLDNSFVLYDRMTEESSLIFVKGGGFRSAVKFLPEETRNIFEALEIFCGKLSLKLDYKKDSPLDGMVTFKISYLKTGWEREFSQMNFECGYEKIMTRIEDEVYGKS